MIGRGGFTAAAIRSMIQDAGERVGVAFELKVVAKTEDTRREKRSRDFEGPNRSEFEYVDENRKLDPKRRKTRRSR